MNLTLTKCTREDLTVLDFLQRRPKGARINKLAREWDPELVGVLEAAEITHPVTGDLIWHVTDGQTRFLAGCQVSPTMEFDVIVMHDLTEQEVAKLFLARNQLSAKVPAFDQYRVGLVAKDPVSLSIEKALKATGLEVGDTADDHTIGAVASLQAIVREGNRVLGSYAKATNALVATLETVTDTWPSHGASRFNGDILRAVGTMNVRWNARFVSSEPADAMRLEAKLAEHDPEAWQIMGKAAMKSSSGGSQSRSAVLVALFVEAFNARLAKARKLS